MKRYRTKAISIGALILVLGCATTKTADYCAVGTKKLNVEPIKDSGLCDVEKYYDSVKFYESFEFEKHEKVILFAFGDIILKLSSSDVIKSLESSSRYRDRDLRREHKTFLKILEEQQCEAIDGRKNKIEGLDDAVIHIVERGRFEVYSISDKSFDGIWIGTQFDKSGSSTWETKEVCTPDGGYILWISRCIRLAG